MLFRREEWFTPAHQWQTVTQLTQLTEQEEQEWESAWDNKEEWIYVDLGKVTNFTSISLQWEGAYAKQYQIQTSNDEENWKTIYTNNNCQGGDET